MSIYQPCAIRGDGATELSPELYESWGFALGRQLPPMTKFVVGGDVRWSTRPFLAALVEGLSRAELDVVDLGLLPAPMIYYARRRLAAGGCAIVTGGHEAAEINGLKWMVGARPPVPLDVAALQRSVNEPTTNGHDRGRTEPRSLDVSFDYVAVMQERFVESLGVQQHVVIDPMHGSWAGKARRYLHAVFPQCLFSTIHDTADGRFNGRWPDCARASELHDLCDAVYRERAHVGIAFDGDGDRIALVDDEGVSLNAEETTWVLLQCLGDELRGRPFVYDVKFSDRIAEAARELGAEPVAERSGHAFLAARMIETNAVFGAKLSGHYFYRVMDGGDDALYTACRVIAYLGRSDQTLAELRRSCPPMYMTPDLRIAVPPAVQPEVIEQIRRAWAEFPQRTIDGLRVDTPAGWALVRSSVTGPALTFRFEGLDWHALDDLVERFCQTMPEWGDEVWVRYKAAMGAEELST